MKRLVNYTGTRRRHRSSRHPGHTGLVAGQVEHGQVLPHPGWGCPRSFSQLANDPKSKCTSYTRLTEPKRSPACCSVRGCPLPHTPHLQRVTYSLPLAWGKIKFKIQSTVSTELTLCLHTIIKSKSPEADPLRFTAHLERLF